MTTDQQIADLKAQIDQLENEQASLREALVEAQVEQWQGRIEDLDVQLHLAGMDVRDRVLPILDRARTQVAEARTRLEEGTTTASDIVATLRAGIEQAWTDVSVAMRDAGSIASR